MGCQCGMELDTTRAFQYLLDIFAHQRSLTARLSPDDVLLLLLLLILVLWPLWLLTSKNGSFRASGMITAAEAADVHL